MNMSKQIPLGGKNGVGRFALVDMADAELVEKHGWFLHLSKGKEYAMCKIKQDGKWVNTTMHRMIMGLRKYDPRQVDHRNSDGIDNRRDNLRISTQRENSWNSMAKYGLTNKRSRYRGVSLRSTNTNRKWEVYINKDGKRYYLGVFATQEEAATTWNSAARKLYGEFAYQNEVIV